MYGKAKAMLSIIMTLMDDHTAYYGVYEYLYGLLEFVPCLIYEYG